MENRNILNTQIHMPSLVIRMLTGAAFGLLLIGLFVFSAGNPNPEWGKLWMIRPLLIVPLAGAAGGAFYYFLLLQFKSEGARLAATVVSLFVYIIGLWIGSVLGLAGTYWD